MTGQPKTFAKKAVTKSSPLTASRIYLFLHHAVGGAQHNTLVVVVHRQRVQKFDDVNPDGVVLVDGVAMKKKVDDTDAIVYWKVRKKNAVAVMKEVRLVVVEDVVDEVVEPGVSDAGSVE